MATIRPDTISVSTNPAALSNSNGLIKSMPGVPDIIKTEGLKSSKTVAPRAPRVDVEPLYGAVKGAMGESEWGIYKAALGGFMLGM